MYPRLVSSVVLSLLICVRYNTPLLFKYITTLTLSYITSITLPLLIYVTTPLLNTSHHFFSTHHLCLPTSHHHCTNSSFVNVCFGCRRCWPWFHSIGYSIHYRHGGVFLFLLPQDMQKSHREF